MRCSRKLLLALFILMGKPLLSFVPPPPQLVVELTKEKKMKTMLSDVYKAKQQQKKEKSSRAENREKNIKGIKQCHKLRNKTKTLAKQISSSLCFEPHIIGTFMVVVLFLSVHCQLVVSKD